MTETRPTTHPSPTGVGAVEPSALEAVAVRHVLFPSDLSPRSDGAVAHARLLAESFGARLTLYHVADVPPRAGHEPRAVVEECWRRIAASAREHLDHQAARGGVRSDVVVERHGSVEDAIVAYVHFQAPELVVMATHGREGVAHSLAGSVTEAVIQRSGRPVLCVREPEHGTALPYRRILVPTDLSLAFGKALPWAALLARRFGADVLALHVSEVVAPPRLVGTAERVEDSPSTTALERFMGPGFRGVHVVPAVLFGSPEQRILELARTEHVDLIVLSTHGHDSLIDRLLGSLAEKIVRHAPCPVLVA